MKNLNELYTQYWDLKTKENNLHLEIEKLKKEIDTIHEKDFSKYKIDSLIEGNKELVIGVNDGNFYAYIQDTDGDFIKAINNDHWNENILRIFLKSLSNN